MKGYGARQGDDPMQYMMLLFADETVGANFTQEDMERAMAVMGAYNQTLRKAGVFVQTAPLFRTDEAKTLRVEGGSINPASFSNDGGELKVHDGPYADTREQLAGYFFIDVPGIEQAVEWANRCPSSKHGAIEIRPIVEPKAG